RYRGARVTVFGAEVVGGRLLKASKLAIDHHDRAQPFDVGHAVPTRDDEAEREAVLWRQRQAVDRVHEEHLVTHRIGDGKTSFVELVDAALDAPIEPGNH